MTITDRTPAATRRAVDPMRRTSLAAGVLYLITFVSIPTLALYNPVRDHADFVPGAGSATGVLWGAFSEVIVALAGVGTAVVLFPVAKRRGQWPTAAAPRQGSRGRSLRQGRPRSAQSGSSGKDGTTPPIALTEDPVNGMHWLRPTEAVDDPLAPYAAVLRAPRGGRPYVLANMVGGLDGSAAVSGRVGELSSPADARLFSELRSVADVVLVGARTVREERYGPVRLPDRLRRERIESGRPPTPRIAVVTRSLDFDWTIPLFSGTDPESCPYVITAGAADPARLAAAEEHAEVVVAGDTTVDLPQALAGLRDGGAEVVLCEGGPTLLGELAAADHLDELCLSITPLMGGDPLPLSLAPIGAKIARFVLAHALVDDSDLFLRYERRIDA